MTKEELALALDGRGYPLNIPKDLLAAAKASGLVVVCGASDDGMSFSGAIDDEVGCLGGGSAILHREGILPSWGLLDKEEEHEVRAWFDAMHHSVEIKALWCRQEPYAWTFTTELPHAQFDVIDDGYKWCRAIVVSIDDMPSMPLRDTRGNNCIA